MSLTLLAWLIGYGLFAVLAFVRPVWGIAVYFLSFFGDPASWWWGDPIVAGRWNLIAGCIALAGVLVASRPWIERHRTDWLSLLMIAIAVNATIVHVALSLDPVTSAGPHGFLLKFVLLYFLIKGAIRDRRDLLVTIMIFVVALGHIGYEVKFNGAGDIQKGRLEGVGPPTANGSNQLASLHVSLLPLMACIVFCGTWPQRLTVVAAAPFMVNTLLLCNSRAAFLAAIVSAPVFLVLAPRKARRLALLIVLLGGIGTLSLMRDENLTRRFMTTFVEKEERDASAASRLDFWAAGMRAVADYPLGTGGDGFKRILASKYLASFGYDVEGRSVHNGYINEACQWGVQGLVLRVLLLGCAAATAYRTSRRLSRTRNTKDALIGAAILAGLAAFAVTSLFGDLLDNEWGYWIVALVSAYDRVCVGNGGQQQVWMVVPVPAAARGGAPAQRTAAEAAPMAR